MDLGLERLDSEGTILPLAPFNNITKSSFVSYCKRVLPRALELYEQYYNVYHKIDMGQLLKTDPESYRDIRKKRDNIVKELNEIRREIWRRGHAVQSGDGGKDSNSKSDKLRKSSKGIKELRDEIIQIKKEHNFHTERTPYHLVKEMMIKWLEEAHKVISGEKKLEECPMLINQRKIEQERIKKEKEKKKVKKQKGIIEIDNDTELLF